MIHTHASIPLAAALLLATCWARPLCAQPSAADVLAEAAQRNSVVAAVLALPREKPADQLRALLTLIDLGETDVAAAQWQSLSQKSLDAETRVALVAQFGTARFLALSQQDAEKFSGVDQFVEGCLGAAAERSRDPTRLAQLIGQLHDPAAAVRNAARLDLAVSGTAGAVACVEALAQASDRKVRARLMQTLAETRPEVDPLLLAVLARGQGQVRRDVAELAGYVQLSEAVPWLAAMVAGAESDPSVVSAAQAALTGLKLSLPSAVEARSVIRNEVTRLQAGVAPSAQPPAAHNQWWSFDATAGKLEAREVSAATRQILAAQRVARLLVQLPNPLPEDRHLAIISTYQAAGALRQPISGEVERWIESLSTAELSATLGEALVNGSMAAARGLAEQLGRRADPAALQGVGTRRAPLARALVHADRRVRFSALTATMQIAPQQTFVGASSIPKALWYFVSAAGQRQAVVAASVSARAHDWAAQLRGQGYDALPATTGHEAVHAAISSSRLEALFIDSDIGRPLLREVVFQLRSNPNTAHIPIAILCSSQNLRHAQGIAERDARLIALPRPTTADAMRSILERLAELETGDDSPAQRLAEARQALAWVAELLETGHPYDELVRDSQRLGQTAYVPELAKASTRVLAVIGTADSQQLLVELASASPLPLEIRRQAADALSTSVQRVGKLLTPQEVHLQYQRYNASETASAETQAVLSQVLDILEGK
ncbi:MAG: hypothetical protein MK171_00670 [Pirellulales bacterium]|nr:hypothetical protein [Pirellulales bacterium]